MVMLQDGDIQTKEVLDWKGLHLFHFSGSACSQKLRIFLRLKGLTWQSHHINLARGEQLTPFYMGINPRGLVPTLVHDGQVIIESNDILLYLDKHFPDPPLVPNGADAETAKMLRAEDDLHLDLRALTMRFVLPSFLAKRPESELAKYEALGSGTVDGKIDPDRQRELTFWRDMLANGGITDAQSIAAYDRFGLALDGFDALLSTQPFLLGESVSLIDIAWYIYTRRLLDAGYPLQQRHPNVGTWFARLNANSDFRDEVPRGGPVGFVTSVLHFAQKLRGTDLASVVAKRKAV